MKDNQILQGDALTKLKELPEKSINMCMTSPPYWALRDYGVDGQLGLEPTFNLYMKHLCDIFDEVKRVLRDDGTCWVNIGDTYYGGGTGQDKSMKNGKYVKANFKAIANALNARDKNYNYPSKCLCMIPQRFAIEMVNRGWILRNVIIWHKPNCMPSSVKDRFTVDFEYLFFFSKKKKYYFETIYEPLAESSLNDARLDKGREEHIGKSVEGIYGCNATTINSKGRNKRAVWQICLKPFKEAHFAVYPEELCETPIKAGCPKFVCNKCGKPRIKIFKDNGLTIAGHGGGSPKSFEYKKQLGLSNSSSLLTGTKKKYVEDGLTKCNCNAGFSGGIVLDPFFGSGTTGIVALKQNKKFIGIELNPEYIKIAEARIKPYLEQEKLI